ncbi:GAF domain-containing sensor histidine kinase [Belliella sp. DSM 107340]|uniref:histidine kinase n=1 Tax=Belliella calami TaxID=2923436 RepID=A0ABS9UIV4_9BACT|nr:GAF domain-containing sensor histidine kinase [Belliella calami]MCH7396492.1 GAF domain-containing sensor histidine kinase [Belliella calami]
MEEGIVSSLKNEDYAFDYETGQLVSHSQRLVFSFGDDILRVIGDLKFFESNLLNLEGSNFPSKKSQLTHQDDVKNEGYVIIYGEQHEVKDIFWMDKVNKQIKGFLLLKVGRRRLTYKNTSILEVLENIKNPYVIFDEKLQDVLVANGCLLDMVPFPYSKMTNSFQLEMFFNRREEFESVRDWLSDSEREFKLRARMLLGEDIPNWFDLEFSKIEIEGKKCVGINILPIEVIKRAEYELKKNNEILSGLVQIQNEFFINEQDEVTLKKLLEFILKMSGAELGFIGQITNRYSEYPLLKLDAVSDISKFSKESFNLFEKYRMNNFLFDHPGNFIDQCIKTQKVVIINDSALFGKIARPSGHPFLSNFLGIPICKDDKTIAMIGLANRAKGFSQNLVERLKPLISFYNVIVQAIQEKNEKENIIKQKEEKEFLFSNILEKTSDIVLILNKDMTIEYMSPSVKKILGKDSFTLIYRLVEETFQPQFKISKAHYQSLQKIETDNLDKWIDVSLDLLYNSDEEVSKISVIARDTTTRIQHEIKLREALEKEKEVNFFKSQFISLVSHEFKTPLAIIKSSIDIGKFYLKNDIDVEKSRSVILDKFLRVENEVQNLDQLVVKVLESERVDQGEFPVNLIEVNINQFLEEIVSKSRFKNHVIYNSTLSQDESINWDKILMQRVIENILDNAIKYGKNKPVLLTVMGKHKSLYVVIKDNGIGIPKSELGSIFKSFYRASNAQNTEGFGLGLVTVEKFVALNEGEILIDSVQNEGTSVTLIF